MNRSVKFFKTTINGRIGYVELLSYPNSQYIVKFVNDEYSDFISSYLSFGFGVIAPPNESAEYELNGKITEEIAKEVWSDISTRLHSPDYSINLVH